MSGAHKNVSRARQVNRIMDEVYREMFLVEAKRPGAEMRLALSLLRAWMKTDSLPDSPELASWLKKVCPICLNMIEDVLRNGDQPSTALP